MSMPPELPEGCSPQIWVIRIHIVLLPSSCHQHNLPIVTNRFDEQKLVDNVAVALPFCRRINFPRPPPGGSTVLLLRVHNTLSSPPMHHIYSLGAVIDCCRLDFASAYGTNTLTK